MPHHRRGRSSAGSTHRRWPVTARVFALLVGIGIIAATPAVAAPGTITTVAGTGTNGYSGDGGPATSAQLNQARDVAVDGSGNFYIADSQNHRVRKVGSSGNITTVAGTGSPGFSGDGGPATSAELNEPDGVAVDSSGNLYIADFNNQRVRKVSASGTITTVAGGGPCCPGPIGDGGPATSAVLSGPFGVAVDGSGNLYIAETASRVRKVDSSGTITTVAGTGTAGFSGDGGSATSAKLNVPTGVAVDGSGNLYIADNVNHRVRKVDSSGTITTVAGTGTAGYSGDGGAATSAALNHPWKLAVDGSGGLYVTDQFNHRVRKVFGAGTITTVAGTGIAGYSGDGGPATSAQLNAPSGVAVFGLESLYITVVGRVRKVDTTPPQTTITSGPSGETNDPTPTFSFASSKEGSSFWCRVDSGSYVPCTSPKTAAHLTDGSHTYYVRATDPAGNTDPTPAARAFTVRTASVRVSGSTLLVTAATGAKDNLAISRPSASIVRVSGFPGGSYTGSGVHVGTGCTRSGDYTANCSAASGITLIRASSGDRIDKVVNSTTIQSSLQGGTADDTLIGGSYKDTLNGGMGIDVMRGMNGNDQLFARDLTSDYILNCDGGGAGGGADKADLDKLPKDSPVNGCEMVTRH